MRAAEHLAYQNLKHNRKVYASFGIIMLLAACILNLAIMLTTQADNAYQSRFADLNTADYNIVMSASQDQDGLLQDILALQGVRSAERHTGVLLEPTVKSFRGTDFSMVTLFYSKTVSRSVNQWEVVSSSVPDDSEGITVPYYIAAFGEFDIGDSITYQIGGKDHTFTIDEIIEEMQYGNYGTGVIGAYLPDNAYQQLAKAYPADEVVEYSLTTRTDTDKAQLTDEINRLLQAKGINPLKLLNSEDTYSARMMVCTLIIAILIGFAVIALFVSLSLSQFRIQNTIKNKQAEMGTLAAIGYTQPMILCSVILPYIIVCISGSLAGVMFSYAVMPLIESILTLQTGFRYDFIVDGRALLLTVLILAGTTALFAGLACRIIWKLSPVQAIRGIQYGKENASGSFPLEKTAVDVNIVLALKQLTHSLRQNIVLFLVSSSVMMVLSFAGTLGYNVILKPQHFINTLTDINPDVVVEAKEEKAELLKYGLERDPQVESVITYAELPGMISGNQVTLLVSDGFTSENYRGVYMGHYPANDQEVAIGSAWSEIYAIGDWIILEQNSQEVSYEVVGYAQSLNNQGKIAVLTQAGYQRMAPDTVLKTLYVFKQGDISVERLIKQIEYDYADAVNATLNYDTLTQTSVAMFSDVMVTVIAMICLLSVGLTLFVLYMIVTAMITQQKRQFGICKALGYTSRQLIFQSAAGIMPVIIVSALLSCAAAKVYMPMFYQMLFRMLGIMRHDYQVTWSTLNLMSAIQIGVALIICLILARPIRGISAYTLMRD